MARCLVTGGAGFIGSHLALELLHQGHSVVVLDDLSVGSRDRVPTHADFVQGSVADAELVDRMFADHEFDWVFHFAAFAAQVISHTVKRHNYEANVIGSINVINASVRHGVRFFGFASTVGVYGTGPTPMAERHQPEPCDSYGIAKLAMERELGVTMRQQGLPFVAYRMHNVYGEGQYMRDPYRNAVAIFLNQVLRGEPITVYGSGSQVRAFTYVHDIIPAIVRSAETNAAWGCALNIGSSRTNTVLELVDHIRFAMGVPAHPVTHQPCRSEATAAFTDTSLARSLLGTWGDTALDEGIAATAAWAISHGAVELHSPMSPELPSHHIPEWARLIEARMQPPLNIAVAGELRA